jgi:two-component system alkaline phosphatase synthesis response regulator PhoP
LDFTICFYNIGVSQSKGVETMIWCVDHDAQRRNLEIHALRCVGMDAKGYDSADSFWKDLQNECPELILMDAALPGVDPLALIKRIRQSSIAGEIPVIMQAQSSNELDVIRCLDSGADDCLGNPFGMMEMVSRVKAVLRRSVPAGKKHTLCMGELSVDINEHTVCVCGQRVELTLKEFEGSVDAYEVGIQTEEGITLPCGAGGIFVHDGNA